MSDLIVHLTDDCFDEVVLNSECPILVDFWAPWCVPCKAIAPILEDVSQEFEGRVTIAKLDVNAYGLTGPKYGLRGIPTLMLFVGGEVIATKVGLASKTQLISFLNDNLTE